MVRYFLHPLSLPCGRRHSRVCLDVVITENGVRLRLNIVDTPGYGDQVNNENWQVSLSCFNLEKSGY
jgi:septin